MKVKKSIWNSTLTRSVRRYPWFHINLTINFHLTQNNSRHICIYGCLHEKCSEYQYMLHNLIYLFHALHSFYVNIYHREGKKLLLESQRKKKKRSKTFPWHPAFLFACVCCLKSQFAKLQNQFFKNQNHRKSKAKTQYWQHEFLSLTEFFSQLKLLPPPILWTGKLPSGFSLMIN